jgi:hypothetical protein
MLFATPLDLQCAIDAETENCAADFTEFDAVSGAAVVVADECEIEVEASSVVGDIRPTRVSTLNAPNDNTLLFKVSIDASGMSEALIPTGGMLFFEFIAGGDNTGFRVFRNNGTNTTINPTTGVVSDTGLRNWPNADLEGWAGRYTDVPNNYHLAFHIAEGIGFGEGLAGTNVLNSGAMEHLSEATGNLMAQRQMPASLASINELARGFSFWEDSFTMGERRRLPGDRNFNASDTGRDTMPMEHWRKISMPLAGRDAPWGNDLIKRGNLWEGTAQLGRMSGWIDIYLPMVANSFDSTVQVRLLEMTSSGIVRTVRDYGTLELVDGGFASGLTIESRGMVLMDSATRINAVRITEESTGTLAPPAGNYRPVFHHIVRLVAPSSFRWQQADHVFLRGNPEAFGAAAGLAEPFTVSGETITPTWAGRANVLDMWLDPIANRHEIYVHIEIPARSTGFFLSNRNAWVEIEGLVLIPVEGAPTTGEVALDVWVGTTTGSVQSQWYPIGAANPTAPATNVGWASDPRAGANTIFLRGGTLPNSTVRPTRFGWFGENDPLGSIQPAGIPGWRTEQWSRMNLVVASFVDPGLRSGWLFDEWNESYDIATGRTSVTAQWLRLGAVSTGGEGNVTSADIVWLARHIAGHAGFEVLPNKRVANLRGEDRDAQADDITALLRWLVGYDLEYLIQTS